MIPRLYIRDVNDKTIATLDEGDYFDDTLTRYLAGKSSVFEFSIYKNDGDYPLFSAGKKISFRYEGEDFWLNVMMVEQDETTLTITAVSLNLELNNETVGAYSGTSKSFADYFNAMINFEQSLTIGINEVADKKLSNEWTGTSTLLARLFSLATVFSAEVEFVTQLADNGSLKNIVVNVYKEHSDTNQGLGVNRTSETFRFGSEITTVQKSEDISDIYTAILPKGTDGLTIKDVEHEVLDEMGNILYCTYKTAKADYPDVNKIYAPQSRELFPSTLTGSDRWIVNGTDELQYTSAEALYGYALGQLKQYSVPQTKWEISGYITARIGDTIRVADDGYKPEIYLNARITEQSISFTDPSKNKSTFSNVVELKSEVNADLLKIAEQLKKEINYILSTVVDYQVSDQGKTAPTGEWFTDLPEAQSGQWLWTRTTQAMSNGQDVVSYGKSYNGTNGGQGDKGDDGKTSYVHTAYLMADGTFTKVLPGENLVLGSNSTQKDGIFTNFDSVNDEYAELTVSSKKVYKFVGIENGFAMRPTDFDPNKTYTWSFEYMYTAWNFPSTAKIKEFWIGSRYSQPPNWQPITQVDMPWKNGQGDNKLNTWYKFTASVKPSPVLDGVKAAESIQLYYPNADIEGSFTLRIKKGSFKLEEGSTATPYTPSPQDDPINAYPAKEGTYYDFNATGSDDPDDYVWKPFRGIPGVDGVAGKDGVGVKSTAVSYQSSTSGTTAPTGTWTATVPTVAKGSYLWTKTVWTYTDNTSETGYSVAYVAKDGNNGIDGIAGKDGVGITSTTITYAGSTSGITAPTSGWTSTIPTVSAGQYLWTKTVWTYSDNTNETGYSVAKMGDTGAKGDKGPQGDKGATGPQGPAGPKGDQGIMGVAYAQPDPPTDTQEGATWFKTKSATDNSVIGIYTLIGTTWTETPVTADALAVTSLSALSANLGKVTAGELDGVKIVGAEFSNPYSFTDVDQNQFDGTLTIKDSTITNVGTVNKGSTTGEHNYKTVDSPTSKVAQLFKGTNQATLKQFYELTLNGLYLRDTTAGFSGYLSAAMLTETQWTNITLDSGYQVSENNPPQCRMVYNVDGTITIKFRGQVTTTNAATEKDCFFSKNKDYYFGRVPTAFKPPKNRFGRAESGRTNMTGGRLTVQASDGRIVVNFPLQDVNYAVLDSLNYEL